jgi:hypothetical protein
MSQDITRGGAPPGFRLMTYARPFEHRMFQKFCPLVRSVP